jgi:hypothetical protein
VVAADYFQTIWDKVTKTDRQTMLLRCCCILLRLAAKPSLTHIFFLSLPFYYLIINLIYAFITRCVSSTWAASLPFPQTLLFGRTGRDGNYMEKTFFRS